MTASYKHWNGKLVFRQEFADRFPTTTTGDYSRAVAVRVEVNR